jgi:hypothetical protein
VGGWKIRNPKSEFSQRAGGNSEFRILNWVRGQRRVFEFACAQIFAFAAAFTARTAARSPEAAPADQNARGHQKNRDREDGKGHEESLHRSVLTNRSGAGGILDHRRPDAGLPLLEDTIPDPNQEERWNALPLGKRESIIGPEHTQSSGQGVRSHAARVDHRRRCQIVGDRPPGARINGVGDAYAVALEEGAFTSNNTSGDKVAKRVGKILRTFPPTR